MTVVVCVGTPLYLFILFIHIKFVHREREKFTKVILIVNELVGSMITEMVIMGIVIHGTLIIDTAAVTEARYCVTTDWSSCLL